MVQIKHCEFAKGQFPKHLMRFANRTPGGTVVVMYSRSRLLDRTILLRIERSETEGDIMMNSKSKRFLARVLMIAMLAFLALPTAALAQGRSNQDNGRWDRNQDQRRRDRINDRRDRNDDRWDNDRDWRNRNGRNRNDDGYGNYGGSFNLRQTALNAGFADGVKEGRKDRSRGERFDFRDESDFQKATRDYSSRLGDRELYRTYYRQAFDHGYKDGYAGY